MLMSKVQLIPTLLTIPFQKYERRKVWKKNQMGLGKKKKKKKNPFFLILPKVRKLQPTAPRFMQLQ